METAVLILVVILASVGIGFIVGYLHGLPARLSISGFTTITVAHNLNIPIGQTLSVGGELVKVIDISDDGYTLTVERTET